MVILAMLPVKAAQAAGLADQLRQGGYVLLMRHASSPTTPPDAAAADPGNPQHERQLDEKGKTAAKAMGTAFNSLHIPLGKIFSSPAFRARQTVQLAGFGSPELVQELGDQGHSMERITGASSAEWLKKAVAEKPMSGRNTILVTHMPNIAAAFPDQAEGLADGETLVFKPDGRGHAALVAKVGIEEWTGMAH
jgi:phosphohistidine phosphatase SixA